MNEEENSIIIDSCSNHNDFMEISVHGTTEFMIDVACEKFPNVMMFFDFESAKKIRDFLNRNLPQD